MKYYTKGRHSPKSYNHICNKKLDEVIEFIDRNKSKYGIKTICSVLGVAISTYYKSFDKTKSTRKIENEELKSAIIKIYKANKVCALGFIIYFCKEGFKVTLKRVQRRMNELSL